MTESEIHQLIALHVGQIDAAFEFWITISFAVLMAIHIAGKAITMQLKVLICTLYLASSLVSVLLTLGDFAQTLDFLKQLEAVAPDKSYPRPNQPFNFAGMLIRLGLYFFATLSISVAIFRYQYWVDKDGS